MFEKLLKTVLAFTGLVIVLGNLASYVYGQSKVLTYQDAILNLDQLIESLSIRVKEQPKSWLELERLALAYIERARLTGSYQDYAEANNLLAKAFDITGGEFGPYYTRASLYYTLHKLPKASKDAERISQSAILTYKNKIKLLTLRSDIAFQQGNYNKALEGYLELLDMENTPNNLFRLANYYWKTGNLTLADNLISEAVQLAKGFGPQVQAFFYLQQGLLDLDRSQYNEALKHYEEADQVFSGWWLIEEHIAEVYRLKGQTDEAFEIYERVVMETGNPEYMDMLASIALDEGNKELAKVWSDRARARYKEQLAKFPEATYGHALQHYLSFGSAEEALALAKKNYQLRSNGEAQTYLIEAYLKAGQLQDAERVLNDVLKSPWRSAYLKEVATKVYNARGK